MSTKIFSTYSTGENRVTASTLAVLRSLSLERIERLLGAVLEQSEFELVRFENQPARAGESVPDAAIVSSCRLLIETKVKRSTVRKDQIQGHLKQLDEYSEQRRLLLVLTPDTACPRVIEELGDNRCAWSSFTALDQAIDELLGDKDEVISEREAFLLRELQDMMAREGLIGSAKEVLVVPAREAWPMYQDFHAYVCQPNRTFQPVERMAFYSAGQIQPLVPKILDVHENVVYKKEGYPGDLGRLVDQLLFAGEKEEGQSNKIMLLSAPDDPRTLKLDSPIINDLETSSGRSTAFTQNQRYVSLERLKTAKTTSELVGER